MSFFYCLYFLQNNIYFQKSISLNRIVLEIKKINKNRNRKVGIFVFFSVLIFVYYFFDPSKSGYFLKCPLKSITGYECAGCGVQRALHELLHFRFLRAFHYNPLFVLSIPIGILVGVFLCFSKEKNSWLKRLFFNKSFLFAVLAIVLLYSLLRNTAYYRSIF